MPSFNGNDTSNTVYGGGYSNYYGGDGKIRRAPMHLLRKTCTAAMATTFCLHMWQALWRQALAPMRTLLFCFQRELRHVQQDVWR